MDHSQTLAVDKMKQNPSLWLTYVDDKFVVWSHEPNKLHFWTHLKILRLAIQFPVDKQTHNIISSWDILITWKNFTMPTRVYRNPTHKGHYINYCSNHLLNVQAWDIQSLCNRATFICQGNQDVKEKLDKLKCILQLIDYPSHHNNSMHTFPWRAVFKESRCSTVGRAHIHFTVVCDKFKCTDIWNKFSTLSKTKYTHKILCERIQEDPQQTAYCAYCFPPKCGTNYLLGTSRPLSWAFPEAQTGPKTGLLYEIHIGTTCLWRSLDRLAWR